MKTGFIHLTTTLMLMNQQEDKKIAFTMVIDETRAKILNRILNAAMLVPPVRDTLYKTCEDEGIDIDKEFIDEFVRLYHENGFCSQEDCTYPN